MRKPMKLRAINRLSSSTKTKDEVIQNNLQLSVRTTIMNKSILIALVALFVSVNSYGHSGRTDKNGGHNCSAASIEKGLCTGYHYHNGRAYLDVGETLVDVALLDDEHHFHNEDADEHDITEEHNHDHEIDQSLEKIDHTSEVNSI